LSSSARSISPCTSCGRPLGVSSARAIIMAAAGRPQALQVVKREGAAPGAARRTRRSACGAAAATRGCCRVFREADVFILSLRTRIWHQSFRMRRGGCFEIWLFYQLAGFLKDSRELAIAVFGQAHKWRVAGARDGTPGTPVLSAECAHELAACAHCSAAASSRPPQHRPPTAHRSCRAPTPPYTLLLAPTLAGKPGARRHSADAVASLDPYR
jgi:hypothetical protein